MNPSIKQSDTKKAPKTLPDGAYPPTHSLVTALNRVGGIAGFKLLIKQLDFKIPNSTVNGWVALNHIPAKWSPVIERLIEEYPNLKELSRLRDFYGEPKGRPAKKTAEDFTNPELYRAIIRGYKTITRFLNQLNTVMPGSVRVHRRHVYEWLNKGFVPAGPARFTIIHRKLLKEEVIGVLPDGQTEWKPSPVKQLTPAEQVRAAFEKGAKLEVMASYGGVYTREAFLEAGFSEKETDQAFEAAFGIE